jgi:hypothetical protein
MQLSQLIERLTEIAQDSGDTDVYLYTELGGQCIDDLLKDIAVVESYKQGKSLGVSRVILIGTEEDL